MPQTLKQHFQENIPRPNILPRNAGCPSVLSADFFEKPPDFFQKIRRFHSLTDTVKYENRK